MSLFSHIVSRRLSAEYENVATEGLLYIVCSVPKAKRALVELFRARPSPARICHELFHLIRALEEVTSGAQFQYILTTTSRPPDALVVDRLRLKLQGSPATARLLGRDL